MDWMLSFCLSSREMELRFGCLCFSGGCLQKGRIGFISYSHYHWWLVICNSGTQTGGTVPVWGMSGVCCLHGQQNHEMFLRFHSAVEDVTSTWIPCQSLSAVEEEVSFSHWKRQWIFGPIIKSTTSTNLPLNHTCGHWSPCTKPANMCSWRLWPLFSENSESLMIFIC